ncbi:LIM domain-containing protein [Podospora conica]|nr:LIM domain-containing protein [Schizothecium conicum]
MAVPRESTFMPTVKCSSCSRQIEISMMGEHICSGAAAAEPVPPMPAASIFDRFALPISLPFGMSGSADKQTRAAPPQVDTSAANRPFMGQQGQLTPVSYSSGSRSVSPKTPIERPNPGRSNDYFTPQIANDSPPPESRRGPGGYGGLSDSGFGEPLYPAQAPKKAPNFLERMNTIAPGPLDAGRRPSAASIRRPSNDAANDRPGTSASNMSSSFDSSKGVPRAPRKNGYGGFGPPSRDQDEADLDRPNMPNRSETFPRAAESAEPPARTPSAPGSRSDRFRRPSNASPEQRPTLTSERARRPSRGPDTSRPPPPRTSTIPTPNVPSINLAAEFGIGNPYHAHSESSVSSSSGYSQGERRPSAVSNASLFSQTERRPSTASSRSSPPRSLASRSGRNASDTSNFDNLMADLQYSMSGPAPKSLPLSPLQPPPIEKSGRGRPPARRPAPPSERGYDPRIDPRLSVSPLSPSFDASALSPNDAPMMPAVSPDFAPPPSWGRSPEQSTDRSQSRAREPQGLRSQSRPREPETLRSQSRPREPERAPSRQRNEPERAPSRQRNEPERAPSRQRNEPERAPSRQRNEPEERSRSRSDPRDPPARAPSQTRPRPAPAPSSRGDCKACTLPITGKSISSADGRLTGRYHKACFVCFGCKEPFSSSTFYVLDDRPYCENDYHRLNGSLCNHCGVGIEGQYLEDETARKHHVGCFRCGDCGTVLKDGYFEVGGKAYCEKDAWRRVQQPWMGQQGGPPPPGPGRRGPPGPSGLNPGLPGGPRMGGGPGFGPNRLAPPRPKMEKRMTRLGMM